MSQPVNQYLFLDFDGVLNHELFHVDWYNRIDRKEVAPEDKPDFDQRAIDNLDALCEQFPHLLIVVSSTWRGSGLSYCVDALVKSGFKHAQRVVACTPSSSHRVRGVEVWEWLKKHTGYGEHPVDYVIFDDDSDFLLWQANRFIHIDPYVGLTSTHVYKAGRILNRLSV